MESNSRVGAITARQRGIALIVGLVVAAVLLGGLHRVRVEGTAVALTEGHERREANFDGRTVGAHELDRFADVYRAEGQLEWQPRREVLWLGNSQLHAINRREGDSGRALSNAPDFAGQRAGYPFWALSLPNAGLQEHYVLFEWAMSRRRPDQVVIGLVYDDLREDGLRGELELLADEALIDRLDAHPPVGSRLADVLKATSSRSDPLEVSRERRSLADRSEDWLDQRFARFSPLWAERSKTLVAFQVRLHKLRNWLFRIDATTQRRMLPVRTQRNMEALEAMLQRAQQEGVPLLAYIVPLRWDVDPPYELESYAGWKEQVEQLVQRYGAGFADFDRVVPDDEWGLYYRTGQVDFMHFQESGHRRLADAVLERLGAE